MLSVCVVRLLNLMSTQNLNGPSRALRKKHDSIVQGIRSFKEESWISNKQGWFAVTLSLQIKADLTVEQQQQKEWPTWLHRWQPAVTHYKEEVWFMTSKVRSKLTREYASLDQWLDNLKTNFHQRNVLGSVKVRKHLWHNVVDCHNNSLQLIPHFHKKNGDTMEGNGVNFWRI